MRHFIRNIKKHNFIYAMGLMIWAKLEGMSNHKKVAILQEKIEQILNKYDKHLIPPPQNETTLKEEIVTPCGCTLFNDCNECASYPVCRSWMDEDFIEEYMNRID